MIQRVYEQCEKSSLDAVYVATDDNRIANTVSEFGGNVIMTSEDISSGTERCRLALEQLPNKPNFVINVQGDEPFISPDQIDELLQLLESSKADIATIVSPALNKDEIENPNRVKVVVAENGTALYFSRSVIPFPRKKESIDTSDYFIHLGIYGFTSDGLIRTGSLDPCLPETAESLEQLRWLYYGMKIQTISTQERAESIDTPEDLKRIENKYFL